jgi:hypothetical protein
MTAGAIAISRSGILARDFCRRHARAEVAAVFDRSLYLRAGDTFVCLGEPSIGNGPLTLSLYSSGRLSNLGLQPGDPVAISHRGIAIADKASFTLDHCEPWYPPEWPAAGSSHALRETCTTLASLISSEAPEEGLARVSRALEERSRDTPLARVARPRLARFQSWLCDALETPDAMPAASPAPVHALIGLGPGLTPSGDDFLVGALALLDALAERRAHAALAGAIVAAPRGRTSPLSDCLLRAAAAGHVGENLCRAVSAVVSGAPEAAVAAIRTIGHSSGWDMLAGMTTALVCTTRRPFEMGSTGRLEPPTAAVGW